MCYIGLLAKTKYRDIVVLNPSMYIFVLLAEQVWNVGIKTKLEAMRCVCTLYIHHVHVCV